jgi:DNA-binding XRE family transcriptional regulator
VCQCDNTYSTFLILYTSFLKFILRLSMLISDSQTILESFGLVVKKYRTLLGLSQKELASICSLNLNYIGNIERGKSNISLITLLKISKHFGISSEKLIREMDIYLG